MKLKCEVWSEEGFDTCMVDYKIPYTLHELRTLTKLAIEMCKISPEKFALLVDWQEEPCLKDKQN